MIDVYDAETLVKIYRMLTKKCDAIDKFIHNQAVYFGPSTLEYGSFDVCNNILDLIARKNQLINLKLIIDQAVNSLDDEDKKLLYIKMKYSLSIDKICTILDIKERTAFRRITHAFESLAFNLNESKYIEKLMRIMKNEVWISNIGDEVKSRRLSYECKNASI